MVFSTAFNKILVACLLLAAGAHAQGRPGPLGVAMPPTPPGIEDLKVVQDTVAAPVKTDAPAKLYAAKDEAPAKLYAAKDDAPAKLYAAKDDAPAKINPEIDTLVTLFAKEPMLSKALAEDEDLAKLLFEDETLASMFAENKTLDALFAEEQTVAKLNRALKRVFAAHAATHQAESVEEDAPLGTTMTIPNGKKPGARRLMSL